MAGITQNAVDYLQLTGECAVRFGASLEASQHFSHALVLLADLAKNTAKQQQALLLQFSLGQALDTINTAGSDTILAYTSALKLARELQDIPKTISILVALTNNYRNRSEVDLAQKYGEECLLLAEESQNPEHLMMANLALFWLALGLGQCADATSYIEKTISFYRNYKNDLSLYDAYNFGNVLGLAGLVLAPLGFPDRALRYAKEGLALVQQYEHPFGIASALGLMAAVHEKRGEWQDALRFGEMMVEVSKIHNFTITRTFGEIHAGVSLAMLDKPEEGYARVQQAIEERKAMNMHFAQSNNLAITGYGYGLAGQVEKGLAIVNEAINQVEGDNDRQGEAKICQIKGDLLLMQILPEAEYKIAQQEAETCFRRAIKIAQDQQAKLWEARALASLCRLLHSQGRNEGCNQQLADLYGEFTEGFEIEDLRMVRTVIEQLA
jgi:tetratricopeptide (TPR) repeat protein